MKSLHKIILFALLPLMGACSGMLDIEPHSAVSPTVVGSDDIEALRIGMYNKVQEGPTYYSYIAFDLFGGELMTSTGRPIDLINSLSNALHTFVSSQWNGYYKALLQVNNVMSIAEGLADSPTRNRVPGSSRITRLRCVGINERRKLRFAYGRYLFIRYQYHYLSDCIHRNKKI